MVQTREIDKQSININNIKKFQTKLNKFQPVRNRNINSLNAEIERKITSVACIVFVYKTITSGTRLIKIQKKLKIFN